ncbi:Slp family lipoprotein [Kaarinaea lacus]
MNDQRHFIVLAALVAVFYIFVLSVTGCASAPKFNLDGVDQSVQPRDVVANLERYQGKNVLWGGVIINSTNVKEGTQLEILVYPLKSDLKPDTEQGTLGRIIVFEDGYLETLDFAAGRLLTVKGNVRETKKGSVGEAVYTYTVVQAQQLHLWPQKDEEGSSGVRFGIGVMIH